MSDMAYEKPTEMVCEECGSDNVVAMGEMVWNSRWNQWDPTGEISYYYCHGDCGAEAKVVQRPQKEEAA